jgi:ABC-type bacteriocin/lantibiotic exporter with double-glycine peptidase domain
VFLGVIITVIVALLVVGISVILLIAVCRQCVYKPRQRASRAVIHKDNKDNKVAEVSASIEMNQNEAYTTFGTSQTEIML